MNGCKTFQPIRSTFKILSANFNSVNKNSQEQLRTTAKRSENKEYGAPSTCSLESFFFFIWPFWNAIKQLHYGKISTIAFWFFIPIIVWKPSVNMRTKQKLSVSVLVFPTEIQFDPSKNLKRIQSSSHQKKIIIPS